MILASEEGHFSGFAGIRRRIWSIPAAQAQQGPVVGRSRCDELQPAMGASLVLGPYAQGHHVDQTQPGSLSLGPDSLATDLIDEPLEDSPVPPHRLAGVGAALGSFFSLMVVVLAIGTAGTVSGPRSGMAADPLQAANSTNQSYGEAPQTPGGAVAGPTRRAGETAVPIESRLRLQSLERAAMLARAEVEAAESRLALLRSDLEHRALERAERERARAAEVESSGSPYEWMTTEQIATRTRDRARSQLDADIQAMQSLSTSAEGELVRLRDAADAAESALTRARVELMSPAPRITPSSVESTPDDSAGPPEIRPPATLDGDLRSLIVRHHACLVEAASIAATED